MKKFIGVIFFIIFTLITCSMIRPAYADDAINNSELDNYQTEDSIESHDELSDIDENESEPVTQEPIKEIVEEQDDNQMGENTDLDLNDEQNDSKALSTTTSGGDLKKGDSNERVKELKEKLAILGFVVSQNPNNNFGPSTEAKVIEFQKYYGLNPTGVADRTTLNKIEEILSSPFRNGGKDERVIQLKKDLEKLGFKVSNNPNQNYGPSTTSKVREFQTFYGLVENGIADPVTLDKITELLNTPMKNGDYRKDAIYFKEKLANLGFVVSQNPTPAYGPSTERTVKEFQKYYGLSQTGAADKQTMDKLDELLANALYRGQTNDRVLAFKKDLADLGFTVSSNPNRVFGPSTEKTVKDFQKYYGLRVTGVVEEKTLETIASILSTPFRNGGKDERVIQLKKDLEKLGFKVSNKPNHNYGPSTTSKVREFQTFYGLVENGIADPVTLDKITELLNTPMKNGDYRKDAIYFKERLAKLGFVVSQNLTPAYGPSTERTVKEFQKYYGLSQTGAADQQTMDKLEELLANALYRGQTNDRVLAFKEDLAVLGFKVSPNPNGVFGPSTEKTVKDFQKYYGLRVTGVVEEKTLEMIASILSTPFRDGGKDERVIQLKKDLERLGFKVSDNPNQSYGPTTTKKVKEFQEYYGLRVNGIADQVTRSKIKDILTNALQKGKKSNKVIQLKKDLAELGFKVSNNPNENFGPTTERVLREFQETYGLVVNGIADEVTLAKIQELKKGITYTQYNLTIEQAVEIQMNQKAQTDKKEYAWVSKSYIDKNSRVTATALNVRTQPTTKNEMGNKILGTLSRGTKVDIVGEKGNWYAIKYSNNNWVHAVEKDVRYYLDPDNFINDSRQRFQFLDLSRPSGAPKEVLNNYLKGKGELAGQGQAFIDAARLHGVNDIYLISHAMLETGNGTSALAEGVEVGLNKDGKAVRVTSSNRKSLKDIKTVYNMYGIGAVDSNPLTGGAIRAYNEGWDTVKKAIIGGAEFIGGDYIKNGQNTIYKMRWNPLMSEGMAWKQYATDIGWASKQVNTMYNLYNEIGYDNPILDIPVYK